MPKKFYSVKETSRIIGVSTNTVYKYLDDGSLKGKRMGGRGRFKIPYSEVAPYLTQVDAGHDVSSSTAVGSNTVAEVAVPDVPSENNSSFLGPILETVSIGLGALLILWGVGGVKNFGGAVLSYSGRTFSGFGNLISQVMPAKKTEKSEVAGAEVSAPVVETTVPEEKPQDLNNKLKDTERLIYELYANTQTLDASAQKLLGKERTLTTAELNDAVVGMLQLLGASSGSPDESTIYAQVNNLTDSWNFPALVSLGRPLDQVSSGLDLITKESLGAFTKPEAKDINDLIAQTDLLQRLVGNITDTTADATVFGNLRKVEAQAKALDAKNAEIDKILGDWGSYDISEKENSVKVILSDTLSINTLPQVVGILPVNLSGQIGDTDLKNILLTAKGVLEANKIHLSQKDNVPVAVTWTLSDGAIYKALIVNPSEKSSQEVAYKYYLLKDVKIGDVKGVGNGLALNFDSQKNQYFMEANVQLPPGQIKTLSLQVGEIKQAAVTQESPKAAEVRVAAEVKTTGIVAGASIINSETQQIIGAGISFFALGALAVYLLHIIGSPIKIARLIASGVKKLVKSILKTLLSIKRAVVVVLMFPVKVVRRVVATIVAFFSKVWFFVTSMITSTIKILVSIKKFIFSIPGAILTFVLKVISLVKNFFVSLAKSLYRLVISAVKAVITFVSDIISAVKALFKSIISAIKKAALSIIKTLSAIKDLFLNIISSIVKFIVAAIVSLKKGIQAVIDATVRFIVSVVLAIKNFIVKTVNSIVTFIEKIVLAITKTVTFVIASVIGVLVTVTTFFLKTVSLTTKTLASVVGGLYKILVAVTERTDSTLGSIHFEQPRFRHSRTHYRKAAIFILVAILSAVISSVFAITVMAQI